MADGVALHFRLSHTLLSRLRQFDISMTHRELDNTEVGGERERDLACANNETSSYLQV